MKVEEIERTSNIERISLKIRWNPQGDPTYKTVKLERGSEDHIFAVEIDEHRITHTDIAILNALVDHEFLPNNWLRYNGKEES